MSIATASTPTPTRSPHRWWALGVLALAQFLVVLDASIVNIALPALGAQLQRGTAALAWVTVAFVKILVFFFLRALARTEGS